MTDPNFASNVYRYEPEEDDLGKRIDVFFSERIEGLSRTRIQELIEAGRAHCAHGPIRKSNYKLRGLGWVEISLPTPEEYEVPPEDLPIRLLFEDDSIAVVVKPPGMPTHPSGDRIHGTLVNALRFHLTNLSGIGGALRPGIVHRLDRVTSGILVIAKTQQAHIHLSDQFRQRKVKKVYRAICLGKDPGESGLIEGLINRHPTKRKKRILAETGRASRTGFERIKAAPPLYGILLYPETGRTHQLRVHLESRRCPILLDELYGYESIRWTRHALNHFLKDYPGIFLHAESLSFTHPVTREAMRFRAAPGEVFAGLWQELFQEELREG